MVPTYLYEILRTLYLVLRVHTIVCVIIWCYYGNEALIFYLKTNKNNEQPYHHHQQQQQHIMQYLFDNEINNYIDLDYSLIRHNQFLDSQDKFPDFDLRVLSFDCYSHPSHILQAKEVVLWTPSYQHVIITSSVLDRNGTERSRYKPKTGNTKVLS